MQKNLNKRTKASGGLLKDKKGLTLVELIVAVAILGIIVSPILHAFTTSQTIESKSRRLSEATDIVHNIQEVIDTVSVADFLGTDDSKDLLEYDSLEKTVDIETGFDCAIIKGLESGRSKYDAKIIFGTSSIDGADEEDDIFAKINQMEIVDYSDPDGTFAQPYESSANPDDIAEAYFFMETGSKVFLQKKRNIDIEITSETNDEDGSKKTFVNVTYNYSFIYKKQETKNGIGTGNYVNEIYTKSIVYSAIPAGASPHEDGTPLSCYIMYYPFYNDTTNKGNDNINIYNTEDIPLKLLLVKQWPMVYDETNDKYDEMSKTELYSKEIGYQCYIKEYHSTSYNIKAEDKTLYTNASINLAVDGETGRELSPYRIVYMKYRGKGSNIGQKWNLLIKDGGVITTTRKNRFYDVAIYLYEEGTIESGEPIAKFKATKAE